MQETERIELKRELTPEVDIEKEVVAFLNGKDGMSEKMSEKIDPISKKVIELLENNPTASVNDISQKIKEVTKRTIERSIARLKAQGRLRRIGPDKGGHWEVIKPQNPKE